MSSTFSHVYSGLEVALDGRLAIEVMTTTRHYEHVYDGPLIRLKLILKQTAKHWFHAAIMLITY